MNAITNGTTAGKAQLKRRSREINRKLARRYWRLYVLLALPIIYLLVFKYYPMLGVQIAFRKFDPTGGIWHSEWVGLHYFEKFFTSSKFMRVVPNTIIISLYSLIAGFPVPILLALSLNTLRNERYKKTIQTITYIPHFISTVVMVGILFQTFNVRSGLVGVAYKEIFGRTMPDLFGKPASFRHLFVWSGVWQSMGWSSIIYIAALSSVDPELHEAAQIDGASRFKRVIHIDFPSILPTAVILLILNSGSIMSVGFEKVYLMQNNLNLRASEVISTYTYKVSMSAGTSDFSYGTAIGLFNSVINLMMLSLVNTVSNKLTSTSLW